MKNKKKKKRSFKGNYKKRKKQPSYVTKYEEEDPVFYRSGTEMSYTEEFYLWFFLAAGLLIVGGLVMWLVYLIILFIQNYS